MRFGHFHLKCFHTEVAHDSKTRVLRVRVEGMVRRARVGVVVHEGSHVELHGELDVVAQFAAPQRVSEPFDVKAQDFRKLRKAETLGGVHLSNTKSKTHTLVGIASPSVIFQ